MEMEENGKESQQLYNSDCRWFDSHKNTFQQIIIGDRRTRWGWLVNCRTSKVVSPDESPETRGGVIAFRSNVSYVLWSCSTKKMENSMDTSDPVSSYICGDSFLRLTET